MNQQESLMRVIIIDPSDKTVVELEIQPTWEAIRDQVFKGKEPDLIQEVVIPTHPSPSGKQCVMFVDEDGLRKPGQAFFSLPRPKPNVIFAGRTVIGVSEQVPDKNGEPDTAYHSIPYSVDFVYTETEWLNIEFVEMKLHEYVTQHPVLGEVNVLQHKSVFKNLATGETFVA